jgi:hypothetical protein
MEFEGIRIMERILIEIIIILDKNWSI